MRGARCRGLRLRLRLRLGEGVPARCGRVGTLRGRVVAGAGPLDPAQALVAGLPEQGFEPGERVEVDVGAGRVLDGLGGGVQLVGIVEAFDGVGVDAAPLVGLELLPYDGVPNAELGRLGERFVRVDDASGDFEGGNGMSGE